MITALALRLGISKRLLIGGAILLAIIAAIVAWNVWLSGHDKDVIEADRLESNLEAVKVESRAKEQAAVEKASDDLASRETEKDLKDAVSKADPSKPDAARTALNCQRLRRAGAREADLPVECRS